jgi:hypothetical protein
MCRPGVHTLLWVTLLASGPVPALDLLPDLFDKPKITNPIWKISEQFVALARQGGESESYPANAHPVTLETDDLVDALKSLELWDKGGFFRNEQAHPVFTPAQAKTLGQYLSEALIKAKPEEDVIFTVRGYSDVVFDTFKDREWTSGRVFYAEGRLNLIIGTFKIKKDRGVRNAEAAHGVMDNTADLYFDPGSRRRQTGNMPGRIVASTGVDYRAGKDDARPDWVVIDVPVAALAWREGQIPEEQRQTAEKNKQEAAKLTLERRQMREEMARLRQQIKDLSAGGGAAGARTLEDRLSTLQALRQKNLITEEEYAQRRDEILKDI